ncbi:MGH1-like glycoside hydrolase domain-containing protein [Paractinoplanes toevensis]|uniref:Glucosidase n=1 Tax=Paractinoplanes toevensis TaxID=571911 RepID=A0A919W990_9ACTN|nr:glucosidase [Actinoplanes toevensis]GIM95930.1 glucosidase [Actinoplanes toevensis]
MTNVEQQRLADVFPWRRWGPYLSERQWGSVREDYSPGGDAWNYLSHDAARSRAYRWGEDGIAGFSDDHQLLCLALAMWNGRDPILKERFFGVTNSEGNHGEDVKEYYFYVDGVPSHAYQRMIYKYPQAAFPYEDLVATNRNRGRDDFEYELLDTGVFAEDRYFDVEVEYAKAAPEDILCRIKVHNRGPDAATLHLLPTLWFRNTWNGSGEGRPSLFQVPGVRDAAVIEARHPELGRRWLLCQGDHPLLFTDNEDGQKDAIGRYVVDGARDAVHTSAAGTKAAQWVRLEVPAGGEAVVRVRLTDEPVSAEAVRERLSPPSFDEVIRRRRQQADDFYAERLGPGLTDGERQVARQALAGMLWSKQYFGYDVERWLTQHGRDPLDAGDIRNGDWNHLRADDIISMPDAWEYPWFAAWDLAFHTVAFSVIDLDFAKRQLDLLLSRRYLHPNGQIPAYEWNFGDVNPPVHAWATYLVYELDKAHRGDGGDRVWLATAFQKLARNFTWWVNRKDLDGRNVFQGGFLGLDNIGVFDRSAPLPTGGHLDQADGTAWMALYCQNMLQLALELARDDPAYLESAQAYVEHFAWIAAAVNAPALASMWDEEDGFFYDLLRLPDGSGVRLKVRSMVGLLPLAAATVFDASVSARYPQLIEEANRFLRNHPSVGAVFPPGRFAGRPGSHLLALFDETRLRRILARMLDEDEFLSPYGLRSLSRFHAGHPFEFDVNGQRYRVAYTPAESDSGMFGGNSNWRGPVWFPVNALMIRALLNLYVGYGDEFTVECPTGSGVKMTLYDVAKELSDRLTRLFLPGEDGHRPCYGGQETFAGEHWRDLIQFSEYFHGDNGAGLGAAHQTGWTGLAAVFPLLFARVTGPDLLEHGMTGIFQKIDDEESQ